MIRLLAALALLAGFAAGDARAEVLTCAAFKDRLTQALGAQAQTAPAGAALHPDFAAAGGSGTVKRYNWSGVPHLAGKLTCGAGDAFADFYMAYDPKDRPTDAPPADLAGFGALAAASICALSDGSAQACRAMVTTMTDDAIDQYRDDIKQGDDRPQGLQDYDFADDLDAVFFVTPVALSWAVGPGIYATVDAARSPFAPKDQDKDQ